MCVWLGVVCINDCCGCTGEGWWLFGGDHGWWLGEGDAAGGGNARAVAAGAGGGSAVAAGTKVPEVAGLAAGCKAFRAARSSASWAVWSARRSASWAVCVDSGLVVDGGELPLQRCILAPKLFGHLVVTDEIYRLRIWANCIIAIIIMARCRDPQTRGPGTHARPTHWCEWRGFRNQGSSLLLGMQLVVVLLLPFEQLVADRARHEVVFSSRLLNGGECIS
jgi:hypothetical protein